MSQHRNRASPATNPTKPSPGAASGKQPGPSGHDPLLLELLDVPLPPVLKTLIDHTMRAFRTARSKTAREIVLIGQTLECVRTQVGREHYQAWLRQEFPQSRSNASDCIRAARLFGKVACLDNFQPSALYLLVRKSVNPAAVEAAIQLASGGETISKARAKEIIAKYHSARTMCPADAASQVQRYLFSVAERLPEDQLDAITDVLLHCVTRIRQLSRRRGAHKPQERRQA